MAINVLGITLQAKPLSAVQRMNLKTMTGFKDIKNMVGQEIDVENVVTIQCHIDEIIDRKTGEVKPEKDYNRYICISPEGDMYVTSSETFHSDVWTYVSEILGEDEETYKAVRVKIVSQKSDNNEGDFFKAQVVDLIER